MADTVDGNAPAADVPANFAAKGTCFAGEIAPPASHTATPVSLAAIAAGAGGFKIFSERGSPAGNKVPSTDNAGASVASVGDLNGDGLPEVVVGAPGFVGTSAGQSYHVVWGKPDGAPASLTDVAAGEGGFRVSGAFRLGFSVASVGDLNGDGRPEVVGGAPGGSPMFRPDVGPSTVAVVWGKPDGTPVYLTSVAAGAGGFIAAGGDIEDANAIQDGSGSSVAPAGDLNGDGLPELVIGAPLDGTGGREAGAAYVLWGRSTGTPVDLTTGVSNGVGGFKIVGEAANGRAGASVASVGDLNGDGLPELLVGAHGAFDPFSGRQVPGAAYVVWGKADGAPVDLAEVAAGHGGYKISGAGSSGGAIGDLDGDDPPEFLASVAAIGDLNGDGLPEVLVGAPGDFFDPPSGERIPGAAYVVWGKADGAPVDLAEVAAGHGGVKLSGASDGDRAGFSVGAMGDLNGDGRDEILVGAPNTPFGIGASTLFGAGAAYVVFSSADWIGAA